MSSDAYIYQWTDSSPVEGMVCSSFGARPLPKPILVYPSSPSDCWEQTLVKLNQNKTIFLWYNILANPIYRIAAIWEDIDILIYQNVHEICSLPPIRLLKWRHVTGQGSLTLSSLQCHHNGRDSVSITSLTIVYSTVNSDADQRKHQSSASLAFVRGIHLGPVTRKMFPFDDVIMWVGRCVSPGKISFHKRRYNLGNVTGCLLQF